MMDEFQAAPKPRRLRLSLRLKLGLTLGLVAALAVLSSEVAAQMAAHWLRQNTITQNLAIARLAAGNVRENLRDTMQELHMLAADPDLQADVMSRNLHSLNRRLEQVAPQDPDLTAITILDSSGRVIASSLQEQSTAGLDFFSDPSVQAILAGSGSGIATARIGLNSGLPVVPLGVAIRSPAGKTIGVLEGSFSLKQLQVQLGAVQASNSGYATILDNTGTVLSDPDPSRILTRIASTDMVASKARAGTEAAGEMVDAANVRMLAAAVPVQGAGWTAEVRIPLDQAMAPANRLRWRTALAALAAFVIALMVGGLLARRLTKPLEQLRLATRRLAGGAYDEAAAVDITSGDELEDLARDFGVMALSLRSSMEALREHLAEQDRLNAELEIQLGDALAARSETRSVLDAIDEAVVFMSTDRRVLSINRRCEELFGTPGVELVGKRFEEFWPATKMVFKDPECFLAYVRNSETDASRSFRGMLDQSWPEERTIELFSAPVTGPNGLHLGRLFVFRDLTRERAADRAKAEFVSLVSHELRTPLTSIRGYVELLLADEAGALTPAQREFLAIVQANGERLLRLIDDLLDMSHLESGSMSMQRIPLELSPLIEQEARALRPAMDAKGQRLTLALQDPLPRVMADGWRIRQVIVNLLSNAIKYTAEGGLLAVEARVEDGRVRVDVRDSGIGLTQEDREMLFTRFFRARNRATQEVSGSGLGLAISQSLIQLHGGEIVVDTAPGKGSTFSFTLPLASAG